MKNDPARPGKPFIDPQTPPSASALTSEASTTHQPQPGNLSVEIRSNKSLSDWSGSLTILKGFTGTKPDKEFNNLSWDEATQIMRPAEPTLIVDKKQARYFLPCLLKDAPLVGNTLKIAEASGTATIGKMRSKNHVTEAALLVMDVDGLSEADFLAGLNKIRQDGLTYLVYSSFSNGNPSKPGMHARIAIPLDCAVNSEDYFLAWHGFGMRYFNGLIAQADSSGAHLYQQQGTWSCDPSRRDQALSWENKDGIASSKSLIALGKQLLISSAKAQHRNDKGGNADYPPSDANKIADRCQQIQSFRDKQGAGQSEPLWMDCLGVVGHCENGDEFCQNWSSRHAGYSEAKTTQKLAKRRQYAPTTCDRFRKINPEGCRDCTQQCRSPITLGWPQADKAPSKKAEVKKTDVNQGSQPPFGEVEPHPDPVDPAILLDLISALIRRHIVINRQQADAVTLWIVLSWLVDDVEVLPLLFINALEKACGKSQLLELIAHLVAKALPVANISTAALFRTIDRWQPTLLIDEADTFIRERAELKGLINAGHTRSSAFVLRTVGDAHEPKRFNVFSPKAFAGIALERQFTDATMSRAVIINMRRKTPDEKVERIRHVDRSHFAEIQAKLARFAIDHSQRIRQARPLLPEALSDRAQDNWEPLFAIAECAGPEWVERARAAALALSRENDSSMSISAELLADIKHVFESKKVEKISTVELIEALIEDEEAPWATFNRGRPMTPRQLAGQLEKYGIKSKTVRMTIGTPKGYDLGQFRDAFARYLTPPADDPQP